MHKNAGLVIGFDLCYSFTQFQSHASIP